jgi:alkaline phosphatase D
MVPGQFSAAQGCAPRRWTDELAVALEYHGAMKRSGDHRVPNTPYIVSRREVLQGAGALGAAALVPACGSTDGTPADAGPPGPESHYFQHGVASGDPLPDAVILWTRITRTVLQPISVTWEMAAEPAFAQLIGSGTVDTNADRDYTVKVDARGLEPGRTYYYRFRAGMEVSPVGRTRTAPQGPTPRARFGVASCSSYAQGYFHAYRALAGRLDLDAIIHLGDYIYESGPGQFGTDRAHEPARECLTLADYRGRHAQYKRDPDLQAVHRQHPFIPVWDDHESANNSWMTGAENHQPNEGDWAVRKAAAQQAYAEWIPIRDQQDRTKIWRKLGWGDLADLVMLDTRLWGRTKANPAIIDVPPPEDPTQTILGDDQAAWLEEQLRTSTARWRLIGQQVMMANLILSPGTLVNLDQWQGYPASRRRFLDFLRTNMVSNVVVLTGDIHSSFACELVYDPLDPAMYDGATGRGSVAVEMVTPGITSPGLPPALVPNVEMARGSNPHVRWLDLLRQGYMVLDVTPERVQSAWYLYADIKTPAGTPEAFAAAWSVKSGSTRLEQDLTAAPAPDSWPPAAP